MSTDRGPLLADAREGALDVWQRLEFLAQRGNELGRGEERLASLQLELLYGSFFLPLDYPLVSN